MERYELDKKKLLSLINDRNSLRGKYLQIKSLERSLLEYLIFENTNKDNKVFRQLTHASKFIHDFMPVSAYSNQDSMFSYQMLYALDTLQVALNSDAQSLNEIPEVNAYKNFFLTKNFERSYA